MAIQQYIPRAQAPQEDDLSKLAKVVQIAGGAYGLKAAIDRQRALDEQQQLQRDEFGIKQAAEKRTQDAFDREKSGILTPKELYDRADRFDTVKEGVAGAIPVNVLQADGTTQTLWQKPKGKQLSDAELALLRSQTNEHNANAERTRKEAQNPTGKQIPASEAVNIGGANAAYKALDDIKGAFSSNQDISGPLQGYVSSVMAKGEIGDTGKRAKTFEAQQKAQAQIIGKYLEGGKMTDSDIERYKSMLPSMYDSSDAAEKKAQVIQNLIAQKQQAELEGLKAAGYNTGTLEGSPVGNNPNLRTKSDRGSVAPPLTTQQYDEAEKAWKRRLEIKDKGLAAVLKK